MTEKAAISLDPALEKFALLSDGDSFDTSVGLHFCRWGHRYTIVFLEKRTPDQIAKGLGAVAMGYRAEKPSMPDYIELVAKDVDALRLQLSESPDIMVLDETWEGRCPKIRRSGEVLERNDEDRK